MDIIETITQDSGDVEYYTDPRVTAGANRVLGIIDLDVASNDIANRFVKATRIFTLETNAKNPTLLRPWGDRLHPTKVFMNHPFGKGEKACRRLKNGDLRCTKKICAERGHHRDIDLPGNKQWIEKLVHEYKLGNIAEAICITFSSTSEGWYTPLYEGLQCHLIPRTNYYLPDGTKKEGVLKGSTLTYFAPAEKHSAFIREFSPLGKFPNL